MAKKVSPRSANGRPLLVANGFLPIPIPLEQVVEVYRQYGFAAEAVPFALGDMRDTVVYAKSIAALAQRAAERAQKRATVVGISMGGVATLYGLKFLRLNHHVDTLLALGSPFHGSPIAQYGVFSIFFMKTGQQLRYNSAFLQILRESPSPIDARVISIGGKHDFISPRPTTNLEEAENHLWKFGHHETILPKLHYEAVSLLL